VTVGAEVVRLRGAGGLGLAANRYGPSDGPVVMFLHGAGQTRHSWHRTAQTVAQAGFTVLCVDHRGHGDSDWPEDAEYEIEHFADDLEAILDSLDSPPVVVGASLGGLATLVAQGRNDRQLFRAVVLVDITPRIDASGADRILGFMAERPDGFATLEEAADAIAGYTGRSRADGDVTRLARVLRRDEESGRWRWHWDTRFLAGKTGGAVAERAEMIHARLLDAARSIRVPLLAVRGSRSDVVDAAAIAELVREVPGARSFDVRGAGHMVAGDENDAFTGAVLEFLGDLP